MPFSRVRPIPAFQAATIYRPLHTESGHLVCERRTALPPTDRATGGRPHNTVEGIPAEWAKRTAGLPSSER